MSSSSPKALDDNDEGASSSSSQRNIPSPLTLTSTTPDNNEKNKKKFFQDALLTSEAAASSGDFTPPGSPTTPLNREPSVQKLFQSARRSFGGRLQPGEGDLAALDHPIRRGPSRMVAAQDWSTREREAQAKTTATAVVSHAVLPALKEPILEEEEGEFEDEDEDEDEDEEEEQEVFQPPPVVRADGKTSVELEVVTSAPGKVILFGEHAVVYGKPAVGAAVSDLRIVVKARCTAEPSLVIELPDLDVCFRRDAQNVAASFGCALAIAPGAIPAPPAPAHLDMISVFLGEDCSEEKKKALMPLVFLALALAPNIFLGEAGPAARGLSITAFSASLPVGAGLGSSAALCVSTSAALMRLEDLISRSSGCGGGAAAAVGVVGGEGLGEEGGRPSVAELERINAWAFAGETVLHGTPSGLDNTVSCYGGAIKFVKGMDGDKNSTEPVAGFPPLPILLTNTLVPKDTRALVAGVRRLLEAHVSATTAIFDAVGAIASEFLERAAASVDRSASDGGRGGGGKGGALTAECVGELAEMNHRLLCALGVGHPALEKVCAVANARGFRSKLTGAGGGGCALTILSGDKLSKEALVEDMALEGFKCYRSSLGGQGVLFHDEGVPPEMAAAAAATVAAAVIGAAGVSGRRGPEKALRGRVGGVHGKGFGTVAIAVAFAALGMVIFASLGQRSRH